MVDDDYKKIRDAMDAAAELLRKKEREKLLKEQEQDKYDKEIRRPLYKKVLYIGLGVIFAIFIILIIIYLFTRNRNTNVNNYQPQIQQPQFQPIRPQQPQFPIPIQNNSSSFPITTLSSLPQRMGGGRRKYRCNN